MFLLALIPALARLGRFDDHSLEPTRPRAHRDGNAAGISDRRGFAAPLGSTDFASQAAWLASYAQLRDTLPSAPLRLGSAAYNAAATLARRGRAPMSPGQTFREMLDEKQQLRNNGVLLAGGPDPATTKLPPAAFTIIALKALTVWHEKQPDGKHVARSELRDLYPLVDALAESPHIGLGRKRRPRKHGARCF